MNKGWLYDCFIRFSGFKFPDLHNNSHGKENKIITRGGSYPPLLFCRDSSIEYRRAFTMPLKASEMPLILLGVVQIGIYAEMYRNRIQSKSEANKRGISQDAAFRVEI